MELFLNVLWAVIAAVGLCLWRMFWVRQPRERQHAWWRQWSAFVCALVLLFFMVSLTDDLHSELIIFEECSAGRRHATCLVCLHHAQQDHATGTPSADLTTPNFVHSLVQTGSVGPENESSLAFFHAELVSDRAPPPVSL
jgi:hypothetical protein